MISGRLHAPAASPLEPIGYVSRWTPDAAAKRKILFLPEYGRDILTLFVVGINILIRQTCEQDDDTDCMSIYGLLTKHESENPKGRDHLKDLVIDRSILLKRILKG